MQFKFDTKTQYTIISLQDAISTENLSDTFAKQLLPFSKKQPPNIILNLHRVLVISNESLLALSQIQEYFYDNNCSFIFCHLQDIIEEQLESIDILNLLNIAEDIEEAEEMLLSEIEERE